MTKSIPSYAPASLFGLTIFTVAYLYLSWVAGWNVIPFRTYIPISPSSAVPEQAVDLLLGQYGDRPRVETLISKTLPVSASPVPLSSKRKQTAVSAVTLVPGCSLALSILPVSKIIASEGMIDYSIVVKNTGLETCRSASLSFYYPDNETFISALPKPAAGGYYWKIGDLASDAEYQLSLKTKHVPVSGLSEIHSDACVSADNARADACVDNLIFIGSEADLAGSPTIPGTDVPLSSTPVPVPAPSIAEIPSAATSAAAVSGREFGTWIWDSPSHMVAGYPEKILESARKAGFTSVYITIDDYLDIAVLPAGPSKNAQRQVYQDALASFIVLAKAKGIAVDVEGGWRDWSAPGNRWKGYTLIEFVQEYNLKYPHAKIRNLQYDVEPYLLPSYESNKAAVLKDFVGFIDESTVRMQSVDAGFSIVIPHFYDSAQKWTPAVNYGGKTQHTFTHLLTVLKKKPDSAILIMAYRNFVDGPNGTRQIAEAEVKEASSGGYTTKIIVAQETGNVDPDYVTFYGQSRSELMDALEDINDAFSRYANYGGVAIHYIETFLALK